MIRGLLSLLASAVVFLCAFPLCAEASGSESSAELDDIVSEVNERLSSAGGDEAGAFFKEQNISAAKPQNITTLSPKTVLSSVWDAFVSSLKAPVSMLGRLIAAAAVCVMIKGLAPSTGTQSAFSTVSALVCMLIISDTLSGSLDELMKALEGINSFMVTYIPVFAGLSTASGHAASAAGYYSVMFFVCEIMAYAANKLLVPLISCVAALSLVSAMGPLLDLSKTAASIKSFVTKALGFIMLIFTFLVTVTGLTGNAADTVGTKAVRFAASSFIPVIGGSVSEAYSAVRSSLGVIRTSVGAIGLITVFIIVLRPLMTVIAMKLAIGLAETVHRMFALESSSLVLSGISSVLSIAMSIVIAYSMFFITATSVVMLTAAGG